MSLIPRHPVYIPSKSRAEIATTPAALEEIGVPYRLVVEESQAHEYAARWGEDKLLILDPTYQREYDACMDLGPHDSRGSGPARNFIWEHSISEGYDWHWVVDDNITLFATLNQNKRVPVGDGTIFHAMETFAMRHKNVAMAGPHYWMFAPSREKLPPYIRGSRIYSCILIRNAVPLRWRGRYNEDVDLSLRVLKSGWNTVLFNAFLQYKLTTQTLGGGNTEAFYAEEGTLKKSQMLVRNHPDVARVVWRYKRWHHFVDYSQFKNRGLVPDPAYDPSEEPPDGYRLKTIAAA